MKAISRQRQVLDLTSALANPIRPLKGNDTNALQTLRKIQQEGTATDSFCETSVALIELWTNIPYEHRCKNLSRLLTS